jgi:protein-tyrosine phosphatase
VDLVGPHPGAAVISCTAGKDRTGWVVALTLLSVGVSWDDTMADYLASGPEVARMFAPYREMLERDGGDVTAMDTALGVFPEYLEAARETMLAEFGSLDAYLQSGLGLPASFREQLQARLGETPEM